MYFGLPIRSKKARESAWRRVLVASLADEPTSAGGRTTGSAAAAAAAQELRVARVACDL